MTLTCPRELADMHGFLNDRVTLPEAFEFIDTLRNMQMGELIARYNQNVAAGRHPDEDTTVKTEQALQEDLNATRDWLESLAENGQETISTSKVISTIESETDCEFSFTD